MCTSGVAKCLLIVFNFILFLAGGCVLAIGIWMKIDPTIIHYLHVVNISSTDPLIDFAAWVFIGVGALVFVVGILGCCGAFRGSQSLLFLYAMLLIIIMAAEIVAGVLALIHRKKVKNELQSSMTEQVTFNYTENSVMAKAWNFLQQEMECCGGDNYTDYVNSNWWNNTEARTTNVSMRYVPDSCCSGALGSDDWKVCQEAAKTGNLKNQLYNEGCYPKMIEWFEKNSLLFMIIGFAVGGIQILGVIIACCLRSALKKQQYEKQ